MRNSGRRIAPQINEQQRARIAALAHDFPRLWQDPKTPDRERKRMVRLLLADVTLIEEMRSLFMFASAAE